MWEDIGKICKITAKQAHDCFHNRWSRQFYDDLKPYKDALKMIVQ